MSLILKVGCWSASPLTLISLYHAEHINTPLREEETEQQEAKTLHGQLMKGQRLLTPRRVTSVSAETTTLQLDSEAGVGVLGLWQDTLCSLDLCR